MSDVRPCVPFQPGDRVRHRNFNWVGEIQHWLGSPIPGKVPVLWDGDDEIHEASVDAIELLPAAPAEAAA